MKVLALDIGDMWTGTAISDALAMFARPLQTVEAKLLMSFLETTLTKEKVERVVVGLPVTLRGTESAQTRKVQATFKKLQDAFPDISWIVWDERFSSQQADELKRPKTKEEKIKSHSVAAAFILQSYLDSLV